MNDLPNEFLFQAKEIFEKFDLNKNGSIDLDEMKQLIAFLSEKSGTAMPSDESIKEGLANLDHNKDGVLQFEEFLPFYSSLYSSLQNK